MKLPGGCVEQSKRTAKLGRAIHGLKQSGRKSGHLCADILIADGFEQFKADPCIFQKIVDVVVVNRRTVHRSVRGGLRVFAGIPE